MQKQPTTTRAFFLWFFKAALNPGRSIVATGRVTSAELKSCPNYSKSCPTSNHSSLTWKMLHFTLAFGLLLIAPMPPRTFKNSHTGNWYNSNFDWKKSKLEAGLKEKISLNLNWNSDCFVTHATYLPTYLDGVIEVVRATFIWSREWIE